MHIVSSKCNQKSLKHSNSSPLLLCKKPVSIKKGENIKHQTGKKSRKGDKTENTECWCFHNKSKIKKKESVKQDSSTTTREWICKEDRLCDHYRTSCLDKLCGRNACKKPVHSLPLPL